MSLWAALVLAQSSITFVDFTTAEGLELVGSAKRVKGAIRLAPAKPQQVGAAWLDKKYPVRAGFEVSFQFRLTAQDGLGPGADGLAFVIQNRDTLALAGPGGSAGFAMGGGWNDRMFPGIPRALPSSSTRSTTSPGILRVTTLRSAPMARRATCSGRPSDWASSRS